MTTTIAWQAHQPEKHLLTVGDWIRWSSSLFQEAALYFGHGTDNAWDEAVQLVLTLLHMELDCNERIWNARITPLEAQQLLLCIQKRVETREPLPYLLKRAWFMERPFYVDSRVLIPRSLLGEWIERALSPWVAEENVNRILEIGTGSGCIAIGCALTFPQAEVDAVDISEDALAVAHKNVVDYHLEDRVRLLKSDVYEGVGDQKYDVIISNPPYVSDEAMAVLPPEYRHEPRLALWADHQGLAVVDRILKGAFAHLNEGGILLVEVGDSADAVVEAYPHLDVVWLAQEQGEQGVFLVTKEGLQRCL